MNMISWNPFREMDDLFKNYHHSLGSNRTRDGLMKTDWMPSVDITENDSEFTLKAELPEVKKEDISVDLNNGVVTISGKRHSETKDEKEHRIERFYGSFSRSFTLPENVKVEDIKAENRQGMLYLHLPKTAVESPKKIQVDVK